MGIAIEPVQPKPSYAKTPKALYIYKENHHQAASQPAGRVSFFIPTISYAPWLSRSRPRPLPTGNPTPASSSAIAGACACARPWPGAGGWLEACPPKTIGRSSRSWHAHMPSTIMRAALANCSPHQSQLLGSPWAYSVVTTRWMKWIVSAKSGTSFDRETSSSRKMTLHQ